MRQTKTKKKEFFDWIKAIFIAAIVIGLVHHFLFTSIVINGVSMEPTLSNDEHTLINKLGYKFDKPERFDIVVFHSPKGKDYIKRVIGLPGDHISYKDNLLYINGNPIDEPYLEAFRNDPNKKMITANFTLEDVHSVKTIPEGYLFVMGDNRLESEDSRHFGLVPMDVVVGKASVAFHSSNGFHFIK